VNTWLQLLLSRNMTTSYISSVMRIESSKVLCFHFMITELRLLNQSKYGNKQLSLPEDGKPSFLFKKICGTWTVLLPNICG
jgi:hypothetical protein